MFNEEWIYISGSIANDPGYERKFEAAEKLLLDRGWKHVINPAKVSEVLIGASYEEFMNVDMYLLSKCSAIYMLNGWENSKGANREYGYAQGKGMDIFIAKS